MSGALRARDGPGPPLPTALRRRAEGCIKPAWRKAESDAEPFLLGRVPAKAAGYAGNPFGAAHVLADPTHVYFADVGTVDTTPDVDTSAGDRVVYRVAK